MLRKLIGGLATALLFSTGATAGTTVLEGSDATTFHGAAAGGAVYVAQLFGYLKSDSSFNTKPVLVICDTGDCPPAPAGTVYVTQAAFAAVTLGTDYSAVYVTSPGGCCSERSLSAADETKIKTFVDAGGSVAIQNYTGGSAIILGFDAPGSEIGGYDVAGGLGGPTCFDTEIFLPTALSKGFTQPPALGCWGHQAYDMDYFGALGFVSLVDSGREFDRLGSGVFSSFLALGGELGKTPTPATVLLAGLGLLGVYASRRRA